MTEFEKLLEKLGLTKEGYSNIVKWAEFDAKIQSFVKKANLSLFENIFGETEGNRLIEHFVYSVKHNFKEFLNYLTQEQGNKLLTHINNCY